MSEYNLARFGWKVRGEMRITVQVIAAKDSECLCGVGLELKVRYRRDGEMEDDHLRTRLLRSAAGSVEKCGCACLSHALMSELCISSESSGCGGGFFHEYPLNADEYTPGGGHVSRNVCRRLYLRGTEVRLVAMAVAAGDDDDYWG